MKIDVYKIASRKQSGDCDKFVGTAQQTIDELRYQSLVDEEGIKKREFKLTWANKKSSAVDDDALILFKHSNIFSTDSINVEHIFDLFNIHNRETVVSYIEGHSGLVDVLVEANSQVRKFFPESNLWLDVSSSPEDGVSEMVLQIESELPVEEQFEQLERLDHDWWLRRAGEWHGVFLISLL